MNSPELLHALSILSRLPGLGPRSAKRLLLHLLKKKNEVMDPLLQSLQEVYGKFQQCPKCFSFDTQNPCYICADPARDEKVLCVVSDVSDVWALERSKTFKGRYHVLGGLLSALEGVTPQQLHFDALIRRVQSHAYEEIIIALNATLEGQTTLYYLTDRLFDFKGKITTLAHGVPVGGELDYLDDGTLYTAFAKRNLVEAA